MERFWAKVEKTDTCWLWTAAKANGYGRFGLNGAIVQAHRVAYELLVGPIPDGLDLDHLCRIRACVNPDHLEPVTRRVNLGRGISANRDKTHCKNGHPFNGVNTLIRANGSRWCRACNNEWHRKRRAA